MVEERTSSPLYTITEGYYGKFVKYDVTSFTEIEIELIKRSFRENLPNHPVFAKEITRTIYTIDEHCKIEYEQLLSHGRLYLEAQCIDDVVYQGELVYYLICRLRHATETFWEDSRDRNGLRLFLPDSIVLIFHNPSADTSRIKYVIPNLTGNEFSGDTIAEFIEALDAVYPKIKHPYACLYGITSEVLQAYGECRWFRPNYIR